LRAEEYVRALVAARAPLLGVCFGHQLIAQAQGGLVAPNPRGREIGTVRLTARANGDPLFAGLPETFDVNATHVDSVLRVPIGARVLATTEREPVAAFALGRHVRAVQFHPELDGDAIAGYVRARATAIAAEGGDPDALVAEARDAPFGAGILANFVRGFVRARRTADAPAPSAPFPS
jgi:GMP synthase (glutamine-hydrolysing)